MFKIKKIFSYILLLLLLASCDGTDTWCWKTGADSYSETDTIKSYVVYPTEILAVSAPTENTTDTSGYGVWVNTGFSVVEGQSYNISVPGGNGSTIITAPAYNTDLETTVILASTGSPTIINDTDGTPFVFSPQQGITITVNPCKTGSSSYGNSAPTKWTWANNWRYEIAACAACQGNNTGNATDVDCTSFTETLCTNYLAPTGSETPTSKCTTSTTSPDCIAYIGCESCSSSCPDTTCNACDPKCGCGLTTKYTATTCGGMGGFGCSHAQLSFTSGALPYLYGFTSTNSSGVTTVNPSSTYDQCPATSYELNGQIPPNPYICQFQSGSTYATTYPAFKGSGTGTWNSSVPESNNKADYCDGYTNFNPCGFDFNWSNSYPGSFVTNYDMESWPSGSYSHCGDSSTTPQSSQSINQAGNLDTCWNTDGYNLYAIQEGIQCPTDLDCEQVWYQYDDSGDTANGYQSNGDEMLLVTETQIASVGGYLYLEIFDPNIKYTSGDSDWTTDIENNDTSIASCNTANNNLYPTLTTDLIAVDNYYTSNEMETLTEDGYSISAAGDISDPTAQNYMVAILQYLDGYTPTTGAYIEGVNNSLYSLDQVLNNNFNAADSSSWELYVLPSSYTYASSQSCSDTPSSSIDPSWTPTTYPPSTEYSDIYDLAGNAILQAQALITYLTPTSTNTPPTLTGTTTSADLITYCNSVISTLGTTGGIQSAIITVEGIQSQIDSNNAQITTLTNQNNTYYSDIYGLNNYTPNPTVVGGYTVAVSAADIEAQYGTYLKAIIVQNGEDPNSALTNADADPSQFTTIFDFTSDAGNETSTGDPYPLESVENYIYPNPDEYPNGAPTGGAVWMKIFDPDGNYANNSQYYEVDFSVTVLTSGFSVMMTDLISTIQTAIQNTAKNIYLGITCYKTGQDRTTGLCTDYFDSIDILLHMYVVIFGIMYLFGLIKTDYVDFIMRIVKIAIISTLLQPYSLDFFNQYFFQAFYGITNTVISAATGAPVTNPFDFLTQTVNVLFLDETTYFKIIGLLFQGLLGIVAFILMIYGCISFARALFNAFVTYMTSFIGMGLCISVAPIFIIFLLFEKTNHLFDNWFKAMVKLTMIPVVLFIGLIIINGMLASILQSILNYEVCFKCTMPFTFSIPGFPQVGDTTLFCVSWFSKWGADNVGSSTSITLMSFPMVLNFCILNEVMRLYSDKLALQVAAGIVGSSSIFKARDPNASLGVPFKGITKDFKAMDKRVEKMAIRSGVAKDKDEYKKMRNKVLKTGLKVGVAVSTGGVIGTVGIFSRNRSNKKDLDPASLTKNTSTTAKQPTLADQRKSALDKHNAITGKINKGDLTKSQRKKLSKQADNLSSKISKLDRKQQYENSGASKKEISHQETESKLFQNAAKTRDNLNDYMRKHSGNQHDPKIAKTIKKLNDLDQKASDKLKDFRKDPDKHMQDEAAKKAEKGKKPDASGAAAKSPAAASGDKPGTISEDTKKGLSDKLGSKFAAAPTSAPTDKPAAPTDKPAAPTDKA